MVYSTSTASRSLCASPTPPQPGAAAHRRPHHTVGSQGVCSGSARGDIQVGRERLAPSMPRSALGRLLDRPRPGLHQRPQGHGRRSRSAVAEVRDTITIGTARIDFELEAECPRPVAVALKFGFLAVLYLSCSGWRARRFATARVALGRSRALAGMDDATGSTWPPPAWAGTAPWAAATGVETAAGLAAWPPTTSPTARCWAARRSPTSHSNSFASSAHARLVPQGEPWCLRI